MPNSIELVPNLKMNFSKCSVQGFFYHKHLNMDFEQYYIHPNIELSENWTLFNKTLNFFSDETVRSLTLVFDIFKILINLE